MAVKHRQLAPTVGRISDDHQANSMGSPNHDDALDKGTTLTFMSWTCVADGSGGFTNYLDDHGHGHREAGRQGQGSRAGALQDPQPEAR